MTHANLRVLEEFVEAIKYVSSDKALMKSMLTKQNAFTRKSKLGFDTSTFLILSMLKRSLNVEIDHFIEALNLSKEMQFTKSAFSQRRHLIKSVWFQFLLEHLAKLYYEYNENIQRWKGYKLLAIDGSTADLVENKEVLDYYDGAYNQHSSYPTCRFVKMHDLLNDIIIKAEMMPMKRGEITCAYEWIDSIAQDSITICDRGFASFTFFYLMGACEKPKDFIVRCKATFNNDIKKFVASNKQRDHLRFYATESSIKQLHKHGFKITKDNYVDVRVEKITLNTEVVEILITSILDEELLSSSDLKFLYCKRWGIETRIGHSKNTFQLEIYSSHLKNGIEQDFYSSLVLCNIHSMLMSETQSNIEEKKAKCIYKYKVNLSASINQFKRKIIDIFYTNNLLETIKSICARFEKHLEPVRPNRKVKREKKTNKRYGKHRTQKNYRNNI